MHINNEIHFLKNFKKLHNQQWATVLNVIVVKGWELSEKFKEYDTENEWDIKNYEEYLLIFLMGDEFIPFTTIRKYNDENVLKYCSPSELMVNFKIVIDEEIK